MAALFSTSVLEQQPVHGTGSAAERRRNTLGSMPASRSEAEGRALRPRMDINACAEICADKPWIKPEGDDKGCLVWLHHQPEAEEQDTGVYPNGQENQPPDGIERQRSSGAAWLREVDQLKKSLAQERERSLQAEARGSGLAQQVAELQQQQASLHTERQALRDELEEGRRAAEEANALKDKLFALTELREQELVVAEGAFKKLELENEELRAELTAMDVVEEVRKCQGQHLQCLEEDLKGHMKGVLDRLGTLQQRTTSNEQKLRQHLATKGACASIRAEHRKAADQEQEDSSSASLLRTPPSITTSGSGSDDREAESLLLQNSELVLTVEKLKQDCELLELENRSLRESAATFEIRHQQLAGQHSQLMGHANHKQKIRHILQLKDENAQLTTELKKARKKLRELQVSRRSESLLEALAPLAGLQPRGGASNQSTAALGASSDAAALAEPRTPRTPRRSLAARADGQQRASAAAGSQGDLGAPLRVLEAERRCRQSERILESISMDFRHFVSLIERVLSAAGPATRPGAVSVGGPGRQESGKEDVSHLLRQLRMAITKDSTHGVTGTPRSDR